MTENMTGDIERSAMSCIHSHDDPTHTVEAIISTYVGSVGSRGTPV